MNIRKLSLAILMITVAAPVVASASPEDDALNACAKAFATTIGGTSNALAYQVIYSDRKLTSSSVSGFYARNFSFTLRAQNPKTGVSLATATCSADTHGEVLAFTPVVSTAKATLASR